MRQIVIPLSAAAISAARISGTPLHYQRVLIYGAGMAGIGVAEQLRDAMVRGGISRADATARFWCVNQEGLLTDDMTDRLRDDQVAYARPAAECKHWKHDGNTGGVSLAEVLHRVKPTLLIGASTDAGSFTETIVRKMAALTERPIIFVLSTPPAQAEANPADLIAWTEGRALIATSSPFAPVTYKGVTYVVAQVSHTMLYPGLGPGTIVSRACRIIDGSVSVTVAAAVAGMAVAEGLARVKFTDIVQRVQNAIWQPAYRRIQAA